VRTDVTSNIGEVMNENTTPILRKSIEKMNTWLHEIQINAGWVNESALALAVLRATLHELRDHLLLNELAHFSAQLPLIVRGIFFENWQPSKQRIKERHLKDFLNTIYGNLPETYQDLDIKSAVEAVFVVLKSKLGAGEVEKISNNLPHGIRDFIMEVLKK
jgi:uncharacterized protein (DUF2267 family)